MKVDYLPGFIVYFCSYDKFILFFKKPFLRRYTFLQLQSGIEESAESSKQQKSEILVCVCDGLWWFSIINSSELSHSKTLTFQTSTIYNFQI